MSQDPSQAIRNLVLSAPSERTKVSRIRELLPDIEQAQLRGVRLKAIATALRSKGFPDMDIKCLQNLLYQARHNKSLQPENTSIKPTNVIRLSGNNAAENKPASGSGGIDAERILQTAAEAAKQYSASGITLELLRTHQK